MKEILKIVVTGGPCAGKTTGLDTLTNYFRSEGYSVFIVNEAATELINTGMRPFGDFSLSGFDFQRLIIKTQIDKEEVRDLAASYCPNDRVVVICDRGILDGKAYVKENEFESLLNEVNLSEADVLSRYDLVIHLVTCADGREEFYTLENNSARTETPEEARQSDRKTMNAWRNHPNLNIVNNDTLFDGKIQKIINIIRSYLGEAEIVSQRKYLLNENDIDFDLLKSMSLIEEEIEEFVKRYDTEQDEMYRKSTINGSSYYTHIVFRYDGKKILEKTCKNISEDEYYLQRMIAKSVPLNKTRYNIIYEGERYRLDIYDRIKGRQYLLEKDVIKANNDTLPSFVKNALDITNDRDYGEDSIVIDETIERLNS